jgi:hypothetical protein
MGRRASGLKPAMALFRERLREHLDAKLLMACHDELLVESRKDRIGGGIGHGRQLTEPSEAQQDNGRSALTLSVRSLSRW